MTNETLERERERKRVCCTGSSAAPAAFLAPFRETERERKRARRTADDDATTPYHYMMLALVFVVALPLVTLSEFLFEHYLTAPVPAEVLQFFSNCARRRIDQPGPRFRRCGTLRLWGLSKSGFGEYA